MSPQDHIAKAGAALEAAGLAILEASDHIDLSHNVLIDQGVSHTTSNGKSSTVMVLGAFVQKVHDRLLAMVSSLLCSGASEQLPEILQILEEHEQLMGIFAAKAETQAITPSEEHEASRLYCCRVLVKTDVDPVLASILDYNGRSLDSHNPWHLHESYEEHLRRIEQRPDPDPIISGPDTIIWHPEAFAPAAPIVGKGHETKQKSIFHTMEDRPVSPIEPRRKEKLYEESKERTRPRQSLAPAFPAV